MIPKQKKERTANNFSWNESRNKVRWHFFMIFKEWTFIYLMGMKKRVFRVE